MATPCLTPPGASLVQNRTAVVPSQRFLSFSSIGRTISFSLLPTALLGVTSKLRLTALFAVADKEQVGAEDIDNAEESGENVSSGESEGRARPCELYVCNIPKSSDVQDLTAMFKPFGTVLSVEVKTNPETGESRGCAYVTMASGREAKEAIAALDESDVGGREIRVRFSVYMNPKRKNRENLNSTPKRVSIYESPYKLYVGNLAWAVKPEDLYKHFSEYGTMVSTRVVQDSKAGKSRSYAFLSFATPGEQEAAMLANGTELHGRKLVARVVSAEVGSGLTNL